MSEHDPSDDETDMLAGEYVLGVLATEEMVRCAERRRTDPAFDQLVSAWEQRLMPAHAVTDIVTPPRNLRSRIEAEMGLGPSIPSHRLRRELWIWRGLSAAGAALACGLLFVLWPRPTPVPERITALLAPGSGGFVVWTEGRSVRIAPVSVPSIPAGRDMELWSLPAGSSTPHSLGVLPAAGLMLPRSAVPAGEGQLLVSLEPAGGSPSGSPTGPVIFTATVHREQ